MILLLVYIKAHLLHMIADNIVFSLHRAEGAPSKALTCSILLDYLLFSAAQFIPDCIYTVCQINIYIYTYIFLYTHFYYATYVRMKGVLTNAWKRLELPYGSS